MGLAEGQSVVAIARAAEQEDDPAMDGNEYDPSDSEPGESAESTDRPGTLDESSGTDVVTNVDETTANPHAEDEERN